MLLSVTTNSTIGLGPNSTRVEAPLAHGARRLLLPVLMFAVGAVGNLVAIVALSVSRQERKSSAFYTLVCGLAVTDLLGTCLASPITIATYLDTHVLQDTYLCAFHSFLLLFFSLAGLSVIFTMAAERYAAICCAYKYRRCHVGRTFAQRVLMGIYLSHVLFCCLPAMGMSHSELQHSNTWCFIEWHSQAPVATAYTVLYGAISLLLILGTILMNLAVCGALLLMRRRTVSRPLTRTSVRERWRALSSAAETQMMAVLVTTSAVVLTCSAPLVVRVFVNRFTLISDPDADLAAIRIASVNPILDPWIYILLRRSLFRRLRTASRRRRVRTIPPSPQTNLFYPDLSRDSHVITQLMCSANVITQLPTAVKVKH